MVFFGGRWMGGEFNLNAREIVQIDGILENYI